MTTADIPLVVDLDGTLIRSDLLIESFFGLAKAKPLMAVLAVARLRQGKAPLKSFIADHSPLDAALLPYDAAVLDYIKAEKEKGRRVYLASASDDRYVQAVAAHLGLFDGAFGSVESRNLAGGEKAALLVERFGEKGFDYIGNEEVDLHIWRRAATPIAANASPKLRARLREDFPSAHVIPGETAGPKTYLKAMRVHQWLKNLLVFVPLLASHAFDPLSFLYSLMAFLAFSLAASSAYLVNDLFDLSHDRVHLTKRHRPLPSGRLPLHHGILMAGGLFGAALLIALLISPAFLAVLLLYYATTTLYSLTLKQMMVVDVLVLAGLYTLRIIAGNVALALPASPWLIGFSVFIFLCLALTKRKIELVSLLKRNAGNPSGRGYMLEDLPILSSLASASGFSAAVVLALYVNSQEVRVLYQNTQLLWLMCPLVVFWISRLLLLANRGVVDDDPVVFAATDRTSLVTGLLIALIGLFAM